MAGSAPTPELQDILARLAQSAPSSSAAGRGGDRLQTAGVSSGSAGQVRPATSANRLQGDTAVGERLRPQARSAAEPRPTIDPATITTWKDGVRCVTKLAATSPHFAARMRALMEYRRHEMLRWWHDREALNQRLASRQWSTTQARSILQSLTHAATADQLSPDGAVDTDVELKKFDLKIWEAQFPLEKIVHAELKALGVPFFGTEEALVVDEGSEVAEQNQKTRPAWSPIITQSQLLTLKRRMFDHLEDLYLD